MIEGEEKSTIEEIADNICVEIEKLWACLLE